MAALGQALTGIGCVSCVDTELAVMGSTVNRLSGGRSNATCSCPARRLSRVPRRRPMLGCPSSQGAAP